MVEALIPAASARRLAARPVGAASLELEPRLAERSDNHTGYGRLTRTGAARNDENLVAACIQHGSRCSEGKSYPTFTFQLGKMLFHFFARGLRTGMRNEMVEALGNFAFPCIEMVQVDGPVDVLGKQSLYPNSLALFQ